MCRVHREATERVLFIGSQPAWTEQAMETRPSVPQNGGNGLVFDRPRSKRDPVHTTRNMSTSDLLLVTLEELVIDLQPFETN